MRAIRGMRIFWRALTWRQQLIIKANALMWSQVAWVNGWSLYNHMAHTRAAELAYVGAIGLSTLLLVVFGMRMFRRATKRVDAEIEAEQAARAAAERSIAELLAERKRLVDLLRGG